MARPRKMRINMVFSKYKFPPRVSTPVCNLPKGGFCACLAPALRATIAMRGLARRGFFCLPSVAMNRDLVRQLRALLVLGRVSNLPTVWSNCLAGWWLGGGGSWWRLVSLSFSVTLLYLGGMFLNDAFDADFDRQNRRSRPIPSGAISEKETWQWGFSLL